MKLPISDRLLACAGFVDRGSRVADIGCDHGYLSIHLLTSGIAKSCIASDVKEGPLQSAQRNARKFGVANKIEFFLSDGVEILPRDFDCMVCAGMGADTMIHILESAPWLQHEQYRLILQCQSKRPELRRYLSDHGFRICRETLARDGKFIYPVMEVAYGEAEPLTDAQCHLSPALLACRSELLPEFTERVIAGMEITVNGLSRSGGEKYEYYKTLLQEVKELAEGAAV